MTTISGQNCCFVHVRMSPERPPVLAGKLVMHPDKRLVTFNYTRDYCLNSDTKDIDPINIQKSKGQGHTFTWRMTRGHHAIPGAFTDCGSTDSFAKRAALVMQFALSKKSPPVTDIDYLILGSGHGVGNLLFSQERVYDGQPILKSRPFQDIEDVMQTALDIDAGVDITAEQAIFFKEGSGAGGDRPKTQITDRGKIFIAKFPREDDLFNNTLAEFVSLKMAKSAGISTAESKLLSTVKGDVLLVERFDVGPNNECKQLISALSLSNEYTLTKNTASKLSYPALAKLAQTMDSDSNAKKIAREIYRRMLFNVVIGNTDDHFKNHSFVDGQLSPCYDVNSTGGGAGSHAISLSTLGSFVTEENLLLCGAEMDLERADIVDIAKDVLDATENWETEMRAAGLSEQDILSLRSCYSQREKVSRMLQGLTEQERLRCKSFNVAR